jgi:Rho termination factor, N-terminal domain
VFSQGVCGACPFASRLGRDRVLIEEVVVPNPSIKDEKRYQKLRDKGASKEKAARIANASAGEGRKTVSKRGGRSPSYDDMSKSELYDRAKKVGIPGRSSMSKNDLISALRNH